MDGLDGEGGVLRVEFDLALDLGLRIAADNEEREASERGGEKDEGKEELGAQAQIDWAVTQKVCDRAAGQEPGAELGERHRASRLRKGGDWYKWARSTVFRVRGVTSGWCSNHPSGWYIGSYRDYQIGLFEKDNMGSNERDN